MSEAFETRLARQLSRSAAKMLSAFSRTDLVKERVGFHRFIRPAKGSVLASPVMAAYDPDPDYFFHWLRDSAVVVDALRLLVEMGEVSREEGAARFADFLSFSLSISSREGEAFLAAAGDYRAAVEPHFRQFLRPQEEIAAIRGDDALGEPRFDPDGALDILKWSRPQHDGPALRVLAVLRFCASLPPGEAAGEAAAELLRRDLAFTLARRALPSFDIWEEELGRHYYTALAQGEALRQGGLFLRNCGDPGAGAELVAAAEEIEAGLDAFWSADKGFVLSRLNGDATRELDIAVVLAAIHAGRAGGPHSVADPRLVATLLRLEALFRRAYALNSTGPGALAPAMGRYEGDAYYSGGAYFFSTFGAAEFYFRAAEAAARGFVEAAAWRGAGLDSASAGLAGALFSRGEAFIATALASAAPDGDLSEQFDQTSGAQTSAKTLAWSHAAFVSACAARRRARAAGASDGGP
ncbi:glycoside hydrolase family 15 protein [Methylocella sp.]|uniref:glycoside hydrolase family 15 protein n=1 Tax=Methylocella sp. TaxID=1978226 RepID=UPI0035B4DC5A